MALPEIHVAVHRSDEAGNVYRLLKPYVVHSVLAVPAGFESDGASVPRAFWRIVFPPGDELALPAAVVHDYLYRNGGKAAGSTWNRSEADDLFLSLMLENGVGSFRAWSAWIGVRIFGGSSWQEVQQ